MFNAIGGDPNQQLFAEASDGIAVLALAIAQAGNDDSPAARGTVPPVTSISTKTETS